MSTVHGAQTGPTRAQRRSGASRRDFAHGAGEFNAGRIAHLGDSFFDGGIFAVGGNNYRSRIETASDRPNYQKNPCAK
jgi:hypothetical protein